MNPYIAVVKPLEHHVLQLTFTNGEHRIFDTKPYLDKGVFKRLRERSAFFGVRVVAGSVEWPSEIDLSYDTLYLESYPAPTDADEPAKYQRTGTLWEGRFRSCVVGEEMYFPECHRYIKMNPVRAGMVRLPEAFRWSSYSANALGDASLLIRPHPDCP